MSIPTTAQRLGTFLLLMSTGSLLTAQEPADYYAPAAGRSGGALKSALNDIIQDHEALTYNETREAIWRLDANTSQPGHVTLIYAGASVPTTSWPDFNREHLWPQSLGARRHPAKSDLHHIFAADANVNSSRGNKPFAECDDNCRSHHEAPHALYDEAWEPPDPVKGDIARALFYMAVRYEGENGEPDLTLTNGPVTSGCDCMGRLDTLLAWHLADPVDDQERLRNNLIFSDIQGNRNPFIDHPEFVTSIWSSSQPSQPAVAADDRVTICSFNIQFLGNSRDRDNHALAAVLDGCDVAVIQELVSPPFAMDFPDGTPVNPDAEAEAFFDEMIALGFDFVLSEEDTGPGERIHRNGSATEWWVAFYDPDTTKEVVDLPHGYLAADRANHPDYDRVPYAFGFRTIDERLDFVLISVHLRPGSSGDDEQRREHELASIADWIDANNEVENDFIVLGDMNIQDCDELDAALPEGFDALNSTCLITNTNVNGPRPYDHVMLGPDATATIDTTAGFRVINLIETTRASWNLGEPFPGDPYDHNAFRRIYSDHHPIVFALEVPDADPD